MDYVTPPKIVAEAVQIASRKARLSIVDMLIRGMLAGAFLAYATSLAIIVTAQGIAPVVGAILFPAGFVMLVLLGLELATGNFAMLPMAAVAGRIGTWHTRQGTFCVIRSRIAASYSPFQAKGWRHPC